MENGKWKMGARLGCDLEIGIAFGVDISQLQNRHSCRGVTSPFVVSDCSTVYPSLSSRRCRLTTFSLEVGLKQSKCFRLFIWMLQAAFRFPLWARLTAESALYQQLDATRLGSVWIFVASSIIYSNAVNRYCFRLHAFYCRSYFSRDTGSWLCHNAMSILGPVDSGPLLVEQGLEALAMPHTRCT